MQYEDILAQTQTVFRSVFNNPTIEVREDMNANDVAEWDSLSHVAMLAAIQKHFNVKFKVSEIMKFKNVGDMCKLLETKLNA